MSALAADSDSMTVRGEGVKEGDKGETGKETTVTQSFRTRRRPRYDYYLLLVVVFSLRWADGSR